VGQILLGPVGGLIGTGAEAAQRRSTDQGIEEQFKAVVGNYDPQKELAEKLRYHLQSAKLFTEVLVVEPQDDSLAKGTGSGGLLKATLREWGLRRCVGPQENVQVGLNVKGELLLEGGSAIWERDELYLDGTCRPWRDFLSDALLKDALARAIDNLAGKITNELLFP
jgi:hypothetical protein